MTRLDNPSITSVPGFRAAGVACGLKKTGAPDLALVVSDGPCRVAAMFTTNRVKAAPVLHDQAILARNRTGVRAVVANSGGANACTGVQGVEDAAQMSALVAAQLGCAPDDVLVMSTGVIGQRLDMAKVAAGIRDAAAHLSTDGGHAAARAIMTTDTRPKEIAIRVDLTTGNRRRPTAESPSAVRGRWSAVIAGMAKGAGMIHPNMATMLCLIATDAAISVDLLDAALRYAVDRSFHRITVDGDTSTNDTVLLLANGRAGNPEIQDPASPAFLEFRVALTQVATELAKMVVRDGEGATKFVSIHVQGARTEAEAVQVGMAVARSNLVKTALFGRDANWGRVLAAVGYSGVEIEPETISLWFGATGRDAIQLLASGQPLPLDEERALALLSHTDVDIIIDLGQGAAEATIWTCDFSYDYVKINAAYRT